MTEKVSELYQKALKQLEHWDLEEAEVSFRQVLELEPDHAAALNKLGVIYARREQYSEAEYYFNQALQIDSEFASAYSNLGNIYQERGWTDRAVTAYERALAIDPEHPTAIHNLGVLYRKKGQIGRGIELMKKAARMEKGKMRSEVRSSPEVRRTMIIGWAIVIGLFIIGLFIFRR